MTTTINASTSAGVVTTADTSGILQLQTASTAALTITAAQLVGIGVTTPAKALSVYGGDGYVQMLNASTGTATGDGAFIGVEGGTTALRVVNQENDVISFSTNGLANERMRISSAGNVGIGTASPTAKLDVTGDIRSSNYFQLSSGSDTKYYGVGSALTGIYASTDLAIWNVSAGNTVFYQNGAERMRIDSSGSFFLNCTSSPTVNGTGTGGFGVLVTSGDAFNLKHTVNGASMFNLWQTGTSGANVFSFCKGNTQTQVGSITFSTTGTGFNTTSDYRLKENVTPMTGALAKVAQLKPVTYKWKIDGKDGEGFIAHELAEVVPDCVNGEKDAVDADGNPKYQGIDTSFLVATLTAAIQELKAINDTQAETINALTARIVALEK
jgi:hypothetical protein